MTCFGSVVSDPNSLLLDLRLSGGTVLVKRILVDVLQQRLECACEVCYFGDSAIP